MPDQADILRFHCECGAKLKAPNAAIGRRIRCPKCKRAFLVTDPDAPAQVVEPQPKPPRPVRSKAPVKSPSRSASNAAAEPTQVPPPIPDPGDELTLADDLPTDIPAKKKSDPAPAAGDDWLNDLAASESEAETTVKSQVAATPHGLDVCANCQKALPLGAAKCPLCGHAKPDPKSKKDKKKKPKAPGDASAGKMAVKTGRFFVGCALSFVGAMVGATIWTIIAAIFNVQLGYAAVGLGALCGYGMALGYGGQSTTAGLAAAFISLVGLIGAKLLIVVFVLIAAFSGLADDPESQRAYVTVQMTEEACSQRACSDDEWDQLYDQKITEVENMTDDEVAKKWQAYQDNEVDFELDFARTRVASFRAEKRGDQEGLYPYHEKRETFFDEEYAKLSSTTLTDLEGSLAEVDAWDSGGREKDQNHLRVYLAKRFADDLARNDQSMPDEYGDAWQTKWDGYYATSLTKVDAMGPELRNEAAEIIAAEDERQLQEAMAELGSAVSSNGASIAAGAGMAIGAGLLMLFGPLDILFALFALGTAYKIAAGGD